MGNNDSRVVKSDFHYKNIHGIRDRLVNTILICIAFLGAPLIIISLLRFLEAGGPFLLSIHFIIYLFCIAAALFRKKIPFKTKAVFVIGCALLMAVTSIVKWGIIGSSISYFIFCSILVSIFYGVRPGIVVTILNLVIISIIAVLFNTGYLEYSFDINKFTSALPTWISTASVYGCYCLVLVTCLGGLYSSMAVSIETLEKRTSELREAKEQMEIEITNRKNAETALKDSEELFRNVLENLPAGVFVHDLEGNNLIVNDEACKSTGYSRDELLSKTVEDTESATFDMDNARKLWEQLALSGESKTFESASHRKDGFFYDTEVHLKSIILQNQPVILVIVFNITERKQAETALRESEERFRTVLENLPCGVSVHDLEGRHLIVNEETCRVKGYSREELLSLTVMDTAGPSLGSNYDVRELWKNIELGASFTFETLTQRKDGSLYDSEVHLTKIMLEKRPVLMSLVFDITERKKIEKTLAFRSELERLISEISSKIVGLSHYEVDKYIDESLASIGNKIGVDHAYLFLLRPDTGVIAHINEWCIDNKVAKLDTFQGIQPEVDMPWFTEMIRAQDIVQIPDINELPLGAEKDKAHFKKHGIKSLIVLVMRQGENMIGFLGLDNVHKKRTWSEDEIVILRLIGQTFTSAVQRKQAEKEQEKLQMQLATAVELAHLGPWELDIENQEYTFSDQFYKIYRTNIEEMGSYKMSADEYKRRFIHPDDIDIFDEFKRKNMKPGAPLENAQEHRFLYADGEVGYVMAQTIRVKNSKGIPVKTYGVNQDITEWKIAQQKLRESEEKLARSKKMESLGLLAGSVAHDLNNVLSGIVSYPELLLLDLPEDSKLRSPIETIRESGNKAVAIVQDLLTIARGAAIIKEPINMNDIILEYLLSPEFSNLKNSHPAVTYKTALNDDLFKISGSPIHIKKVIMNLVSNATEAIENRGNVTISTHNRYVDMPLSKYEDVKTGEYVLLTVLDDGPGIASENLDRIFEPFFTKKVMGISGTGLGLTVVWNTIQDHSGYIDVSSDKNGTKFELYFPITRDESISKTSSFSLDELKGNGELILVVDDVKSQREISCRMLDSLGYRYVAVPGGEEAIEYLKNNKVDLVLLDMIMTPGISGRETYEQIVNIHPGQKAVIISGYSETEDVVATQKLGAGGYVKKPFTLESLGRGIMEELKK